MGETLSGKVVAIKIKEDIKSFVEERRQNGLQIPRIASILVGNDGGSIYYMNNQEKVATTLGVGYDKIIFEDTITEETLIEKVEELNNDITISGIMLQVPLPKHISEKKVIARISPLKDIDCLTIESQGKLYTGEKGFLPCTPNSVLNILKFYEVDIEGKEVVVIGRSNIVGKPVAQLLLNENATVTICHSKSKNIKDICKRADILVVAIGKPKFLTKEFVKAGAILIDVGTSSFDGKITGDIDFEDVIETASLVTPVPGGVGALTTTLLIKNACEAIE